MQLKHKDIWRAIDRLAEKHGLSPSGLARKAGLSPTVFNASKRISRSRKRWPSTESIAHILRATNTRLEDFTALAAPEGSAIRSTLPVIRLDAARKSGAFDEDGLPTGHQWEEMNFSGGPDTCIFAIEVSGKGCEPIYRDGDRLVLSSEKPRRGDRIILRTNADDIMIGQLAREHARNLEITPFGARSGAITVNTRDIDWMRRIVWASQ